MNDSFVAIVLSLANSFVGSCSEWGHLKSTWPQDSNAGGVQLESSAGRVAGGGWGYPLPGGDNAFYFLVRSADRKALYFKASETDPVTGEVYVSSIPYSTSYVITGFAGETSHSFYVIGRDESSGNEIVEYWAIPPAPGAYYCTRTLSPNSPLGTPITTPRAVEQIMGGSFIPPDQRTNSLPARQILYIGSSIGGVLAAEADPDGRYLLLDGSAGLYRLWKKSKKLDLVISSADVPFLGGTGAALRAYRHPNLGRVYLAMKPAESDPGGVVAVFLFDDTNDGILDSSEVMGQAAWEQRATIIGEAVDDFMNY